MQTCKSNRGFSVYNNIIIEPFHIAFVIDCSYEIYSKIEN